MITDPEEDYARGYVPFLGVSVHLDSRPLIPRAETEYWTELALKEITHGAHVLDLFSGSGCIGLAVLTHVPHTDVTFADSAPRHFPTIQKSLEENGIDPSRTRMVESDVWSAVTGTFDFILANPPYIAKERATADESVVTSEPHEALFAEEDGFFFIRKTIEGLPEHLTPHGRAWIEHEPFHTSRIKEVATLLDMHTETHNDQFGVERYTTFRRNVT